MTDLNTGKYVVLARLGLKPSVNELCLAPDKSVYIASYYGDSSDLPIAIVRISLPPASELGAEIRLELEPVATQTFSGIELSALAQREAPRDPGPVGDQGQTGQFEADPSFTNGSPGVLYLMPCGLQVARDVGILVDLAQRDGWEVCIITTPEGREFVDVPALERQTGHPVRTHRDVNDVNSLPSADAIIVAPATVNTIGKWAAGITDTLVLSLLAQAYGYGIPIVVVPYPDRIAALHPRFQGSLAELRSWGVQVLYGEEVARLGGPGQEDRFRSQFPWRRALQAISVRME
jgi:hypothetical protein